MESGQYLPKLRTKDNSTIPHQLHKAELKLILDNDTANRILLIISFRVYRTMWVDQSAL